MQPKTRPRQSRANTNARGCTRSGTRGAGGGGERTKGAAAARLMASPKNLRKSAESPNLVRAWSLHASLSADKALCRPRRVPRPLFQLWCSPRTLRPPRQLTQRVVAGGEEEDKAKKPRTPRGGEEAIKEESAGEGDEEHEDGTTSHPDNGDRCRVRACMHTYLLLPYS